MREKNYLILPKIMEQSVCLNGNGYVYRWPFTCSNWPHSEKFLHFFYLGWYLSFDIGSCWVHGIRRRKLYHIHTWSRQTYELQWFHATFTTNSVFFGAHYSIQFEKEERCYGFPKSKWSNKWFKCSFEFEYWKQYALLNCLFHISFRAV